MGYVVIANLLDECHESAFILTTNCPCFICISVEYHVMRLFSWQLRLFGPWPRNRYEEQAALLEHRQFTNYARSANKCRKVLSESIAHDALTIEEWRVYARRERHRNRPKRMRDHRQNLHIKQLKRMGKVEYDIDRILRRTQQFTRAELNYLFDTKLITPATYHSRTYDRSRRLPYLLETLTRYGGVTEVGGRSDNLYACCYYHLDWSRSPDY